MLGYKRKCISYRKYKHFRIKKAGNQFINLITPGIQQEKQTDKRGKQLDSTDDGRSWFKLQAQKPGFNLDRQKIDTPDVQQSINIIVRGMHSILSSNYF